MNEKRVFSSQDVLDKIKTLNIELVRFDMTKVTQVHLAELNRTDSKNIPVNLIYPADYPNSPAIMLPEVISPTLVLDVLERFAPEPK